MGTKNNPGKYDCYANLHPDEPYFVLMGRDGLAGDLVRQWAAEREAEIINGDREETTEEAEQISEALAVAEAMDAWMHHKMRGKV